ncbi:MAG: monooxygenase [Polyangiales bacterium]
MRFPASIARAFARVAQLSPILSIGAIGCLGCVDGGEGDIRPQSHVGDGSVASDPGSDPSADPTSESGLPCAVDRVLSERCTRCHASTPLYGAPMPLVTYEDLHATLDDGRKVYDAVAARIADDAKPMPPSPGARLSEAERASITSWIAAGAAPGERCADPPRDGGGAPVAPDPIGCTPDVTVKPASAWNMSATDKDVYACFGFEQTVSAKKHATAFRIKVDNPKIVHHVLLFQSDSAVDPTPHPCAATSLATWRMVYGWSPGSKARELPAEAGIPIEGTTHWVVQVHYNNAKGLSGEKDSTGFEMCTTDSLRKYDADMLVFGTMDIKIPPKSKVDKTCTFSPSFLPPIHIVSGSPHMHGLGRTLTTTLEKKDGTKIDLGSAPSFDWNNQQAYSVAAGTVVEPEDRVVSRCVWENATDRTVQWGEGTDDEMCYSFTMYYPKIEQSLWSWVAPALLSSCK